MVQTSNNTPFNLSLCGCGFLGVYHVGVVAAFREYAPEILNGKMAGCSAGSLVAACAMSGCCLGQMCSDALEIAIRARSRALGPLHPTFSIVEIIVNGLRRILPPNAHEICSGRLHISLTRWKDNKNVVVNQFHTREELIQVLVCSSFVPYWSGIIPHKFRGVYYWDGGLTNNNPIIDEGTVLVSPFAGESDICPRDESGSFYSIDFKGTDISCTQENLYRMTRALFPPNISVLRQICWRGYIDGMKFLQTRNMIRSSDLNPKATMSSVLGGNYTEPANDEERQLAIGGIGQDVEKMYEEVDSNGNAMHMDDRSSHSDEESNEPSSQAAFSPFCRKVGRKKELPTPIFAVFADASQKEEDPISRYFTDTKVYKAWSFLTLPFTLPFDVGYSMTKKVLGIFRSTDNTNELSKPKRAANYLLSYFVDENNNKSSYHVPDCPCTESRASSIHNQQIQCSDHPQSTQLNPDRANSNKKRRKIGPNKIAASNQSVSSRDSIGEECLTINNDDFQDISAEVNSIRDFPQPDIVMSTLTKTANQEYCEELQKMADLSNQQRLHEQSMSSSSTTTTTPVLDQDDHRMTIGRQV